jgi:uncharacterized membrane protein
MLNVMPTELGQEIKYSQKQNYSWETKLVKYFSFFILFKGLLRSSGLPLFHWSIDSKSDKASHILISCVFYIRLIIFFKIRIGLQSSLLQVASSLPRDIFIHF